MPIYDEPLSSAGFKPISLFSDTENYGLGKMFVDVGAAIITESVGASMMGVKTGMLGNRPLMSAITPLYGGSITSTIDAAGRSTQVVRGSVDIMGGQIYNANAPIIGDGRNADARTVRRHAQGEVNRALGNNSSYRKALRGDPKSIVKTASGVLEAQRAGVNIGAASGTANKILAGAGIRSLASTWLMIDLASVGVNLATSAIQGIESFRYKSRMFNAPATRDLELGEGFANTRASHTQRQRAMQAIHNSQMNTRAAMGNEATFMHV